MIIGLTGRSGAGKGYVSRHFARIGIDSIDTDEAARSVVRPGSECLAELASYFGRDIIESDGSLKRKYLASIAFASADKTKRLNEITHKYILKDTRRQIDIAEKSGKRMIIVDAPQLFESGFDKLCDVTVGVVADDEVCLRRITERDGISETEAKKRLSRQFDNAYFIKNCDYIIFNNDKEDIAGEVKKLAEIFKRELR